VELKKIDFLGIDIIESDVKKFIPFVLKRAVEKEKTFITYINAHCVNLAFKDPEYKQTLKKADVVYADGQAIVWASKFLGHRLPERINAGDFLLDFCRQASSIETSLFLIGSYQKVADTIAHNLQKEVPELQIKGVHHGFFNERDEAEIVSKINQARADILLVGMGVPRQEQWVMKHLDELETPVVWCVGALFEYFSGYRARAPRWMRRTGFEWLFRLLLEPRRLWRRYLLGNAAFVKKVIQYKFRKQ